MRVVDRGSGVPVVLVPGIQGRWEWMAPAVDALAARCRVITFSLADEPSAEWPARGIGFDAYVEQIGAGARRAAPRARRDLRRVVRRADGRGVSAPVSRTRGGPRAGLGDSAVVGARMHARGSSCAGRGLLLPLFLLSSLRLHREIAAASGGWWQGVAASMRQGVRSLAHFPAPGRMARRAAHHRRAPRWTGSPRVHVPTLVVTGETGARPRGADRAHGGVHAHLAARRRRDARAHRPSGPGDAARARLPTRRAVCRTCGLRPNELRTERRVG